jgi:hypothetical protein
MRIYTFARREVDSIFRGVLWPSSNLKVCREKGVKISMFFSVSYGYRIIKTFIFVYFINCFYPVQSNYLFYYFLMEQQTQIGNNPQKSLTVATDATTLSSLPASPTPITTTAALLVNHERRNEKITQIDLMCKSMQTLHVEANAMVHLHRLSSDFYGARLRWMRMVATLIGSLMTGITAFKQSQASSSSSSSAPQIASNNGTIGGYLQQDLYYAESVYHSKSVMEEAVNAVLLVLSIIITVVNAWMMHFKYSEKQSQHQNAMLSWAEFKQNLEQFLIGMITMEVDDYTSYEDACARLNELVEKLRQISIQRENLRKLSPIVPSNILAKAPLLRQFVDDDEDDSPTRYLIMPGGAGVMTNFNSPRQVQQQSSSQTSAATVPPIVSPPQQLSARAEQQYMAVLQQSPVRTRGAKRFSQQSDPYAPSVPHSSLPVQTRHVVIELANIPPGSNGSGGNQRYRTEQEFSDEEGQQQQQQLQVILPKGIRSSLQQQSSLSKTSKRDMMLIANNNSVTAATMTTTTTSTSTASSLPRMQSDLVHAVQPATIIHGIMDRVMVGVRSPSNNSSKSSNGSAGGVSPSRDLEEQPAQLPSPPPL